MSESDSSGEREHRKDLWDKARILLQPIGGVLAALAISMIGILGNNLLTKRHELEAIRQRNDSRLRLYTELQSNREQADSQMRREMFSSVINTFLSNTNTTVSGDRELLNLELLVYNFHETLNLKPLFLHLDRHFSVQPESSEGHLKRLRKLGRETAGRQARVLQTAGVSVSLEPLVFTDVSGKGSRYSAVEELTLDGITRTFYVMCDSVNTNTYELQIELHVVADGESATSRFILTSYDFPSIDNTRLPSEQRCALVMEEFDVETGLAKLELLYFPASYSSLRDKPAMEELIAALVEEKARGKGSADRAKDAL